MSLDSTSLKNSLSGDTNTTCNKRKTSSEIPRLVDNKQCHMEKHYQAQRDQLLLNSAKEDVIMKREMMAAFEKSNQSLEQSIGKMTNCLTLLGEGIASGIKMMAQALMQQPQYMYGHPGMAAPTINIPSTSSTSPESMFWQTGSNRSSTSCQPA